MLIIKRINIKFKELAFSALYIKKINTRAHFVWNIKFHKSVGKKLFQCTYQVQIESTLSLWVSLKWDNNDWKTLSKNWVLFTLKYIGKNNWHPFGARSTCTRVYIYIFFINMDFYKKNKFILGFTILVILLFMNEFLLK